MLSSTQYLILGLASGSLAGCLAYFHVLFNGFAGLPEKLPSNARRHRNYRLTFFIYRVVYGAIIGFIVTFWFLDEVHAGTLSFNKLIFIQFSAGGCASFIQLAAQRVRYIFSS
ncbi:hypothetical protein [Simplicispira psychrophila]|uniref:hypothetical protein n=1 Tax=Simplicispira psychrophila TaxID=80882 RepID=UPI0012EC8359|nr:hypothetical protein [Simplicispira psychrophila]